jgi:hypothetical protein
VDNPDRLTIEQHALLDMSERLFRLMNRVDAIESAVRVLTQEWTGAMVEKED